MQLSIFREWLVHSNILTMVASFPVATFFFENFSIILGSKSCIKISMVWSGSTSTSPDRYLSNGFKVYKYQQSLNWILNMWLAITDIETVFTIKPKYKIRIPSYIPIQCAHAISRSIRKHSIENCNFLFKTPVWFQL